MNRMVCEDGMVWGGWVVDGLGFGWLGLVGLSLGLGDCVWCVLLPESVANATISSETTPPVSHG